MGERKKIITAIVFWAFASGACSNESAFSGAAKYKKLRKDASTQGDLALPDGGPPPVDLNDCKTGAAIEDPNASFRFNNGTEIVNFVNGFGTYTMIPTAAWNAGTAHADQQTADAICKLKGFVRASNFVTGKYHSCSDNTHGYWNESLKNFEIKNACVSNQNMNGLTCMGKLKDPCAQDPSWVFNKN